MWMTANAAQLDKLRVPDRSRLLSAIKNSLIDYKTTGDEWEKENFNMVISGDVLRALDANVYLYNVGTKTISHIRQALSEPKAAEDIQIARGE
jgi:hypothetical protein